MLSIANSHPSWAYRQPNFMPRVYTTVSTRRASAVRAARSRPYVSGVNNYNANARRKQQNYNYKNMPRFQQAGKTKEFKFHDVAWSNDVDATSNASKSSIVAGLVRGDHTYQFDGGKLFPVGLELRFDVITRATNNVEAMTIRILVIQWFSNSTPVLSDVLENTGPISVSTSSPLKFENKPTCNVLWDRQAVLQLQGANIAAAIPRTQLHFKKYIKARRMRPITYKSGTTAVNNGDIWVFAVADTTSTNDMPRIYGTTRLTFLDD